MGETAIDIEVRVIILESLTHRGHVSAFFSTTDVTLQIYVSVSVLIESAANDLQFSAVLDMDPVATLSRK
jgi:hypothetical protein